MLKRTITMVLLLGVGLPSIFVGGIYFFAVIAFFVTFAAWEYTQIMRAASRRPDEYIVTGGVFLILATRMFLQAASIPVMVAVVFILMARHIWEYDQGRDLAATDFTVSAAGLVYLGWIGGYLVDLRQEFPNGQWWFLFVLVTVWIADTAAYLIGSRWGKTPLSARVSPKKTWEGYWAGVIFGTLLGVALYYGIANIGNLPFNLLHGFILTFSLAVLTPIGDLGESLFKREAHFKDSSELFPGHGGAFDRIDSWIWAGALGFYYISTFII